MMRIPGYCRKILTLLNDAGYECYVVGGAVRDLVTGKIPSDYDLTTSALPDETVSVLNGSGIRTVPTGIRHGTVTAVIDGNPVEITTYRIDGSYQDHRRPDHVDFSRNIEEDVRRRDFTMNALYLDKDGRVVDLTGGLDDIRSGLIRAVGDPSLRFEEDALRIMRGLRFAAATGFDIEGRTYDAMISSAHLLTDIAAERISAEFCGLMTAPYASRVIRTSVPILKVIIPELEECQGFDQRSPYHDKDVLEHTLDVLDNLPRGGDGRRDLSLAMAALFHDIAKPRCLQTDGHMRDHPLIGSVIAERVLKDLRCRSSLISDTTRLVRYHDQYASPDRISVHRFMCGCGKEFVKKLVVLQKADILAHSERGRQRIDLLNRLISIGKELSGEGAAFSVSELKIDGNDIREAGVSPGPEVGLILSRLMEDHINDIVPNVREELLARLKFIIC